MRAEDLKGWLAAARRGEKEREAATRRHLWAPQTNGGPRTYKMHFPTKGGRRLCPVDRCPWVLATRAAMRVQFVHWYVHDTVVILE